jgi:hypothetical protein
MNALKVCLHVTRTTSHKHSFMPQSLEDFARVVPSLIRRLAKIMNWMLFAK